MTPAHSPTPEELMAYLDGELPGETAQDVVRHLATCERCQRLADDLRGVSRDVRSWQAGDVPGSLRCPAVAPVVAPRRSSRVWRLVRAPSFSVAAVAILLVAITFSLTSHRARQSDTAEGEIAGDTVPRRIAVSPSPVGGAGGTAARAYAQAPAEPVAAGPSIARTVSLRIAVADFDSVRAAIDRTLREVGGFVGQLRDSDPGSAPRSLHGTLRIPSARLDEAVSAYKRLGRVTHESQDAEDVTEQVVDLDARIANARITEKRLNELIQTRTGRVADVLEAEREIARVRGELERLDAQRKNVQRRVDYAIVVLDITEEARASVTLGPQPVPARVRYALADGLSSALSSLVEATLFFLRIGPSTALWAMLIGLPVWWFVRRRRAVTR